METVNNVIHAASAAIWGENSTDKPTESYHEEPISGVQGKGAINDPYDAGNRDEQINAPTSTADTAPQEPRLDGNIGKPLNALPDQTVKPTQQTTAPTPTVAPSAKPSSLAPVPTVTPAPAPGITAPSSNIYGSDTTSQNIGTSNNMDTTRSMESAKPSGLEQRSIDPSTGGNGFSNSGISGPSAMNDPNSKVSTEALKGLQGPAMTSAENLKKNPVRDTQPVTQSDTVATNGSDSSKVSENSQGSGNGIENGNGNGKHGAMAKMKERLSKVTHARRSSK